MIALVHAAPATLAAHRHPNLGVLSSPRRFYRDVNGWPWAADNDAFGAWDADRYRRMVGALADLPTRPLFVTMPDVVGDHARTLERFHDWHDEIATTGLPVAFVGQDGLVLDEVPWQRLAAVFVGGTTEWKTGQVAYELVREARARGLHVHMGRVNGHRRLRYAKSIGCDSFDGTSLSWFRDRYLGEYLEHAAGPTQLSLHDAA